MREHDSSPYQSRNRKGAGTAPRVGSRGAMRSSRHRRGGWILSALLVLVTVAVLCLWLRPATPKAYPTKCVIVGLDGLDPKLARKWMDEGLLPNFSRLAKEGAFSNLATSNPPQSPVAWSSFVTGMNPGGTGIFDFVHRDPKTYLPIEAMSQVEPADKFRIDWLGWEHEPEIHIGGYRIPLRDEKRTAGRQGTPFWKYLDDANIPAVVLRVPCNYPPTPGKTTQISGMGTPDLAGSTGAFFYWTDRALTSDEKENLRGRSTVEQVKIEEGQVKIDRSSDPAGTPDTPRLEGPPNLLRAHRNARRELEAQPTYTYFTLSVDKAHQSVRIHLEDHDAVLRPGDWSDWMPVKFVMADWFPSNPTGILRFRLKSLEPNFELYATPVNIDPASPAMPVTNPEKYAQELTEHVGRFTTMGMSEDDKAMGSPVRALDEVGFRKQCRDVLDDAWKTTRYELDRYKGGFFFTYFRTPDVMSHMMWWATDSTHPAYNAELARYNSLAIQEAYRWLDDKVGEIRRAVGDDATFIVMSDHGFAPFYRQFELNSWLADHGWLTLVPWAARDSAAIPDDIDWANTKAYALGLNGLYLNVKGREKDGVINPDDCVTIARELCKALEAVTDPQSGQHVISKAYLRDDVYSGRNVAAAPDIIVGYNYGFRTAWHSALGKFPPPASVADAKGARVLCYLTDNTGRWSGDHCCDPVHVPGLILANRRITKKDPAITDLAPTILQTFHLAEPSDMVGAPLMKE